MCVIFRVVGFGIKPDGQAIISALATFLYSVILLELFFQILCRSFNLSSIWLNHSTHSTDTMFSNLAKNLLYFFSKLKIVQYSKQLNIFLIIILMMLDEVCNWIRFKWLLKIGCWFIRKVNWKPVYLRQLCVCVCLKFYCKS